MSIESRVKRLQGVFRPFRGPAVVIVDGPVDSDVERRLRAEGAEVIIWDNVPGGVLVGHSTQD